MIRGNDPILLTPGPLTTSLATKQAMLRDWGSWDAAFNRITASLCRDLVDIVGGGDDYAACRCRAPAPSRWRRRSATSCPARARCWCRTTARIARG